MDKNTIIETLDYLFEKFGIAVDWTTENVMPYVEQLAEKIVTYKIVTDSILVGVSIIAIIICCICAKTLYTNYQQCVTKKETNLFWDVYERVWSKDIDLTGFGFVFSASATVSFVVAFIVFICSFAGLIKWIFIPELQLIEYVSNLVSNAQM